MVLEYVRLLIALMLTSVALMVALNRHHALLGSLSRLTDLAAERKSRPKKPRRMKTVEIMDADAGPGGWVTGRGKEIPATDEDDFSWMMDDDEDEPATPAPVAPAAPAQPPSVAPSGRRTASTVDDDDDDDLDWLVVDDE